MTQPSEAKMPKPPKYPHLMPVNEDQALGYLVEEAGEVLAAAGKSALWGFESYNPYLPEAERETNRAWLLREIDDLERAIFYARKFIGGENG